MPYQFHQQQINKMPSIITLPSTPTGEFDYIFTEPKLDKFRELVMQVPQDKKTVYFYEFGKYLGYPDCCIADFLDRWVNDKETTSIQNTISYKTGYTGFVPCDACCDKIARKETTISGLITNRRHHEPFPKLHSL
jgi:hypothetical protein